MSTSAFRVLIVGCGNMGTSHAIAYSTLPECQIVGLVAPSAKNRHALSVNLGNIPEYDDFYVAIKETNPDIVCISTYPDTHAAYTIHALKNGAHVFVEKPLATTIDDANEIEKTAKLYNKKVIVGLILQHHPSWQNFIQLAQNLGKPLVMRMNLNQQSVGQSWERHKIAMNTLSPLVDCGVHYVDVMCQMTKSKPVSVHAIGARISGEIDKNMYNYGCLQIKFEDDSVGWYEAAWGPMVSKTAHFVKDVMGPKGSVSIVPNKETLSDSADIESHTATDAILLHQITSDNTTFKDQIITMQEEPTHLVLCKLEQQFLLKAIKEDIDLSEHLDGAIQCLKIVLAADQSIRTNSVVNISTGVQ